MLGICVCEKKIAEAKNIHEVLTSKRFAEFSSLIYIYLYFLNCHICTSHSVHRPRHGRGTMIQNIRTEFNNTTIYVKIKTHFSGLFRLGSMAPRPRRMLLFLFIKLSAQDTEKRGGGGDQSGAL